METAYFSNKIVLITGGTKGIGKEVAIDFLLNGAKVFVIYSNDENKKNLFLEEIREKYYKLINNIFFYKGDISDINFARSVFDEINKKFKKLDVLVNNAGINRDNLFLEMTLEEWEKVLNVNVKGTYIFTMLAKELLVKGENAKVINISSISGIYGKAGQVNYSVSKGCIIGITKYFANKFIENSINVNVIVPGLVETDFTKNLDENKAKEIVSFVSMKRMGKPSEIKDVIMFLASKQSNYINGKEILVDGGFLI